LFHLSRQPSGDGRFLKRNGLVRYREKTGARPAMLTNLIYSCSRVQ
jgi:hypothetical protein